MLTGLGRRVPGQSGCSENFHTTTEPSCPDILSSSSPGNRNREDPPTVDGTESAKIIMCKNEFIQDVAGRAMRSSFNQLHSVFNEWQGGRQAQEKLNGYPWSSDFTTSVSYQSHFTRWDQFWAGLSPDPPLKRGEAPRLSGTTGNHCQPLVAEAFWNWIWLENVIVPHSHG